MATGNHKTLKVTFWFHGEKIEVPGDNVLAAGLIPGTSNPAIPFIDVKGEGENVLRYINYDAGAQLLEMGPPPLIDVTPNMPRVKLS